MTINCVLAHIFRIYSAKRITFASSSAASISSITQNGVGRTLSIAKYRAIATNAFSPPDSRLIFDTAFPGGCTLISMPHSSGSDSSSSVIDALPPPKSSMKVCLKFSSISLNSRRNTSCISLVTSFIMPNSSVFAFSISSRWPVRNSYLLLTRSYSSIAPILGVPSADICRRRSFMPLISFCRFSTGWRSSCAAEYDSS